MPRLSNGWAPPALPGQSVSVYLSLTGGAADDRLVRVTTPWAGQAAVYESVKSGSGQTLQLPALAGISLAAGQQLNFAPGKQHIVLSKLTRELQARRSFPLFLTFEKAGTLRIMVQVKQP